jgi:hypothetical protein
MGYPHYILITGRIMVGLLQVSPSSRQCCTAGAGGGALPWLAWQGRSNRTHKDASEMIVTLVILACFSPTPLCMYAFVQANTCNHVHLYISWCSPSSKHFSPASTGTWELASIRLTQVTALACYTGHGRLNQKKPEKRPEYHIISCGFAQNHSLPLTASYFSSRSTYIYGFTAIAL